MKMKVLDLLHENARMAVDEIATRLNKSVSDVEKTIAALEKEGVIKGYCVIVNESAIDDNNKVKAFIEVKVTPRRDGGFDHVARRIAKFPEVTDLYLVSGSYDLLLSVEGSSLQEVAEFVASKLSPIEGVVSTATLFRLKKYKEYSKLLEEDDEYKRLKVSP